MSQTFDFYDARADDAEAAAGRAELDNVRDRELRSAAVFRKLADQARKVLVDRAKAWAEKLPAASQPETSGYSASHEACLAHLLGSQLEGSWRGGVKESVAKLLRRAREQLEQEA